MRGGKNLGAKKKQNEQKEKFLGANNYFLGDVAFPLKMSHSTT
jgi:hypothetical protein